MNARYSSILLKATNRVRRTGLKATARYCMIFAKHEAHHVLYDRRWDRLEHHASGESRHIDAADVLGPPGEPEHRDYQATPRLVTLWCIEALGIDPWDYSFIDYGSGRGRALLTAARLPFRKVVGVEFSRSLHEEACENIAYYPKSEIACSDVAAVHGNAVDFDLPDGNCVAFFFNPFQGQVLDAVAGRIEAACRQAPRRIHVIFYNSKRIPLFTNRPAFHRRIPALAHRIKLAALSPVPIEFFDVRC